MAVAEKAKMATVKVGDLEVSRPKHRPKELADDVRFLREALAAVGQEA